MSARKQRGFSLVEVMIVVGVMGFVALGLTSMSKNMLSSTVDMNSRTGRLSLINTVLQIIQSSATCTSSLVPGIHLNTPTATLPGLTEMKLILPDGSTLGRNQVLKHYSLVFPDSPDAFQLTIPKGSVSLASPTAGNVLWVGGLSIKAEKSNSQSSGGTAMNTQAVGAIMVEVDPTGTIISCNGGGLSPSQLCMQLGGIWSGGSCRLPSPCDAGKVQVGTQCKDVGALIGSLCGSGFVVVANGSGGYSCEAYVPPGGTPGPSPTPTATPVPTPNPTPTATPALLPPGTPLGQTMQGMCNFGPYDGQDSWTPSPNAECESGSMITFVHACRGYGDWGYVQTYCQ